MSDQIQNLTNAVNVLNQQVLKLSEGQFGKKLFKFMKTSTGLVSNQINPVLTITVPNTDCSASLLFWYLVYTEDPKANMASSSAQTILEVTRAVDQDSATSDIQENAFFDQNALVDSNVVTIQDFTFSIDGPNNNPDGSQSFIVSVIPDVQGTGTISTLTVVGAIDVFNSRTDHYITVA